MNRAESALRRRMDLRYTAIAAYRSPSSSALAKAPISASSVKYAARRADPHFASSADRQAALSDLVVAEAELEPIEP